MNDEDIFPDSSLCFVLYANCLPVLGATRALLCDLETQRLEFIPSALYDMLVNFENKALKEVIRAYGRQNEQQIREFYTFLLRKGYGQMMPVDEAVCFSRVSMDWKSPALIENAIVDSNRHSDHPWESIITQLSTLGCTALLLRFFDPVSDDILDRIFATLEHSAVFTVELIIPWNSGKTLADWHAVIDKCPRVKRVCLHSLPKDQKEQETRSLYATFTTSHQEIGDSNHCGYISPHSFSVNMGFFIEAQKHNTCLNGKVSIDTQGDVCNCPAMKARYGNIADINLASVVKERVFRSYGEIAKDQIAVCQDCEFRYICSDCRAFVSGLHDKPFRCGYDPYTATWSEVSR